MTDRTRILTILKGEMPDRIPWIPRISLWYNARIKTGTMPSRWRNLSLREVEENLGLGTPARQGKILETEVEDLEIVNRSEDGRDVTEYHTPEGSLRTVTHYSDTLDRQGLPGRTLEYPLKGPKDYKVWEYIVEHTKWIPRYDEYLSYDAETGDAGLPMVTVGDVPFHEFAEKLAGYENAFYQLADHPAEVDKLLGIMSSVQRERMWPVVLESPARLFLHGLHLSTQFTPPKIFRKYVLPYYEDFIPALHSHGKAVAMHADNDTTAIVDLIEQAGWDMVECFVTAPMVPLTMEKAREVWGERMIIWGGIPSLLLSPSVPEDEFREYMRCLFRTIAPGKSFILGVADNVMPDSVIERIEWISEFVEKNGSLPLS